LFSTDKALGPSVKSFFDFIGRSGATSIALDNSQSQKFYTFLTYKKAAEMISAASIKKQGGFFIEYFQLE